jgi:hypothetical protein
MVKAVGFQPMVGTVDSPHAVFITRGSDHVGRYLDGVEAAKIEWLSPRRDSGAALRDIPRGRCLSNGRPWIRSARERLARHATTSQRPSRWCVGDSGTNERIRALGIAPVTR